MMTKRGYTMGFLTFCLLQFWDGETLYIDAILVEDDLRGDSNIPSFLG